jgi:hypothetical protein
VRDHSDDDALLSRRHAEFVVGGGDVLVRPGQQKRRVCQRPESVEQPFVRTISSELATWNCDTSRTRRPCPPHSRRCGGFDRLSGERRSAPAGTASGLRNAADAVDEEYGLSEPGPSVPTPSTAAEEEPPRSCSHRRAARPRFRRPVRQTTRAHRLVRPPIKWFGDAYCGPPAASRHGEAEGCPVPASRTPESTGLCSRTWVC